MATWRRFELLTDGLEGRCSIQLSYQVMRIDYYNTHQWFCKGKSAVVSLVFMQSFYQKWSNGYHKKNRFNTVYFVKPTRLTVPQALVSFNEEKTPLIRYIPIN